MSASHSPSSASAAPTTPSSTPASPSEPAVGLIITPSGTQAGAHLLMRAVLGPDTQQQKRKMTGGGGRGSGLNTDEEEDSSSAAVSLPPLPLPLPLSLPLPPSSSTPRSTTYDHSTTVTPSLDHLNSLIAEVTRQQQYYSALLSVSRSSYETSPTGPLTQTDQIQRACDDLSLALKTLEQTKVRMYDIHKRVAGVKTKVTEWRHQQLIGGTTTTTTKTTAAAAAATATAAVIVTA